MMTNEKKELCKLRSNAPVHGAQPLVKNPRNALQPIAGAHLR